MRDKLPSIRKLEQPQDRLFSLRRDAQRGGTQLLLGLQRQKIGPLLVGISLSQLGRTYDQRIHHIGNE